MDWKPSYKIQMLKCVCVFFRFRLRTESAVWHATQPVQVVSKSRLYISHGNHALEAEDDQWKFDPYEDDQWSYPKQTYW